MSRWLWFRTVVDFVHVISAGVGPGAVLALWLVRNGAVGTLSASALLDLQRSWTWVLLILFAALVLLIATGAIRLGYWDRMIRPESRSARARGALIKHALFVALFVYASVMAVAILNV